MSTNDDDHSGIPTRAIHEAYLDMQRALKRYRTARDGGAQAAVDDAHGDVQETVLTLYELLRPHLKHNDAVAGYWDGEPPRYTGNGTPPDPEAGTGVLDWQTRTQRVQVPGDGDVDKLEQFHERLGLNGEKRLTNVVIDGDVALIQYHAYEIGLRRLDDWQTEYRTVQTDLGGFMGDIKRQTKERERVKMHKLKRASRELSNVAEELGALSHFDASTPRTEITEELKDDIEEWRQNNIE
jgi:hypothetical protein